MPCNKAEIQWVWFEIQAATDRLHSTRAVTQWRRWLDEEAKMALRYVDAATSSTLTSFLSRRGRGGRKRVVPHQSDVLAIHGPCTHVALIRRTRASADLSLIH